MIFLRQATSADLALIMSWRSNPLIYQGFFYQDKPLTWEEHYNWWRNRNRDWREFIIVLVEDNFMRDVGVVTIGQLDNWNPEIGYYVGEVSLWNKGIGTEAVKLGCDWLRDKGYEYAHTTIKASNKESIKLIKKLGFKYACQARKGELRYECQL